MIFKILYYVTATICALVGIAMLAVDLISLLQSKSRPFTEVGLFYALLFLGGLLTFASYFMFKG